MGVELQRGTTFYLVSLCTLLSALAVFGATDPGDIVILEEFRKGIINPEKLGWPEHGDPCGPPSWKYVFCSAGRVTQIQTKNLNLAGSLPKDLNKLTKLSNLGLQNNHLSGPLPSLTGLSELRYAFLDNNNFDSIPNDFFDGLDALEIMALDHNPLNETTGWSLPIALSNSAQLATLSLISSNLAGPLPDFLGSMVSLTSLRLSMNRLSGGIPGTFNGSNLQFLWLNGQDGGGMTGPIDVIATMPSLTSVWLHGNSFSGSIPSAIGDLTSLKDFNLNSNEMVGLIPPSLADLELDNLDLNNNHFMGSIPKFKTKNATYSSNSFCLTTPGLPCAPEVTALIEFLEGLTYPVQLVSSWSGNDPCGGWLGLSCDSNGNVNVINLPNHGLNGTLSPSVAKLGSMSKIILRNNNLNGPIPLNWTTLNSLTLLDLTGNDIAPPLPTFRKEVHLSIDKVLSPTPSEPTKSPSSRVGTSSPPAGSSSSPSIASPSPVALSPPDTSSSPTTSSSQSQSQPHNISASNSTSHGLSPVVKSKSPRWPKIVAIAAPVVSGVLIAFLLVPLSLCYFRKRRRDVHQDPNGIVIHPGDSTDPYNELKIVVTDPRNDSVSTGSGSRGSSAMDESHTIEAGNLVISVQVLRKVTKNFASENEIGRGGFGVVYKGELDYGTKIAVKRMESGVINNKALDEFRSEITVLSKVRHRHLVSLLGYSVQGNERLLVYEYMPQGALSRHLFHWKSLDLEPLSWKQRLNIALDVARGIEYLHALAHQSFIHRDLKSSNILLDDDFRAKVSDFGLVKLAPNGEKSIVTRLAGTFGYLAPEYAVTGKITTKADVFSFGVVLMEILTGLMALDEDRPEEKQYLAAWFWRIKSDKEKLMASMDPTLDIKEDTYDSIAKVAELAGHCTAREPGQRPEMGHAVSVLGSLVEKWRPLDEESEDYCGIDYSLPLNQMVKGWQESEGRDMSYMDLEDSKGSIPSRPTGFADSFTSTDGR